MKVLKFGGTSVQDAAALTHVRSIIAQHQTEQGGIVVVLSATAGTTSTLLELIEKAIDKHTTPASLETELLSITQRHTTIAEQLISDGEHGNKHLIAALAEVSTLCGQLGRLIMSLQALQECTPQTSDAVVSYGEQLSTTILHHALLANRLQSTLVDARELIKTSDNFQSATVLMDESRQRASGILEKHLGTGKIVVTQGFIGSTTHNQTTTLGRGGSDYSAALIGAFVNATEIKIYTDVSGVFSADPRRVPTAHPISQLSFAEVREMALYGAKVLHPDTIAPAVEQEIPVRVLNTFKPEDAGTVIMHYNSSTDKLHAVSCLNDCVSLTGKSSEVGSVVRASNLVNNIVLQTGGIERSMVVVQGSTTEMGTHLSVALAGSSVIATDVCIIALCGPTAGHALTMADVANVCKDYTTVALVTGISDTISFVVCSSEHGTDLMIALHQLTTA